MGVLSHRLVLLRHGETEWSLSGQHTGSTDLDLTDNGRAQAVAAAPALADLRLDDPKVISSPRRRAVETANHPAVRDLPIALRDAPTRGRRRGAR